MIVLYLCVSNLWVNDDVYVRQESRRGEGGGGSLKTIHRRSQMVFSGYISCDSLAESHHI